MPHLIWSPLELQDVQRVCQFLAKKSNAIREGVKVLAIPTPSPLTGSPNVSMILSYFSRETKMRTEKAERITITLPPDMLATIKTKVQSGAYGSTSEVIREAMRFWGKQQEEHEARLALIRHRLIASAQSGEPVPLDDAFRVIERMHQQRLKSSPNGKI